MQTPSAAMILVQRSLLNVFLLVLAAMTIAVMATEETINLEGRLQFADQTPFNVSTKISVNHGDYTTYSRVDGNFTIPNVPPGVYQMDVLSPTHHFTQVKCQFKPDNINKPIVSCLAYAYPGATKQVLEPTQNKSQQHSSIVLTALAEWEYFEPPRAFSIFSILKNPMVIMMLLTVALMWYMPKLMEGMEPEERERMQKQMEMQQNPTKMLGELFGGTLGGVEQEPVSALEPPKSKKKSK